MWHGETRLQIRTAVLGVMLALLVAGAALAGWLDGLERWAYDRRVRDCQFFQPPPTDQLVHLDISDEALFAIHKWPFPRSVWAQVLEELRLAGATAVGFDILFAEPTPLTAAVGPAGVEAAVDHDALMAQAMRRQGNVVLAAAFTFDAAAEPAPILSELEAMLRHEPELPRATALERLRQRGHAPAEIALAETRFPQVLSAALLAGMEREMQRQNREVPVDELQRHLLPNTDPRLGSPASRLVAELWPKAVARRQLQRFMRPPSPGLPPVLPVLGDLPPIHLLAEAAAGCGFVDYLPDPDGKVRCVPLWIGYQDRFLPQIGLALACAHLGVDPAAIELDATGMTIPLPDGRRRRVPLRSREMHGLAGGSGLVFDIPFFGPAHDPLVIYDYRRYQQPAAHLSVNEVWNAVTLVRATRVNGRQADELVLSVYGLIDAAKLRKLEAQPLAPEDAGGRVARIDQLLADLADSPYAGWMKLTPAQQQTEIAQARDPAERLQYQRVFAAINGLPALRHELQRLPEALAVKRQQLRQVVQGKAVLIGATATAMSDFVGTALHGKAPGVVVHGVIFNAILTGQFWRVLPGWVTIALTLGAGLAVTAAVTWLSPLRALAAALGLMVAYWVINGIVLFDYADLVVGFTAPTVAIGLVWAGCTLARFIVERRERARVTRRFRSYVDPTLVDYVLEHPEQAQFDGQVRPLTVVFTDLAGFTTLTEQAQEKTVAILKEYLGLMVPLIGRERDGRPGGYVNKFMGDGMMFFFGAPRQNPRHAPDALACVLEMQQALLDFNRGLAARGWPQVHLRAGVCSGEMVVGDAGPRQRSEYTVLGDAVNLAARLESANKAIGTRVLINDLAASLAGDLFLLRPVGWLQVAGKTQAVAVYEPLGRRGEDGPGSPQRPRVVELSGLMVRAYRDADFAACLASAEQLADLEAGAGPGPLYARLCREHLAQGPGPGFQGQIVLASK